MARRSPRFQPSDSPSLVSGQGWWCIVAAAAVAAVVVVVFAYVVVVVVVAAAGIEVVAVVAGNFVAVLGKVVAELGHFPVLVVTSGSFSHSLTRLNMTHCSVAFAVGGTDY